MVVVVVVVVMGFAMVVVVAVVVLGEAIIRIRSNFNSRAFNSRALLTFLPIFRSPWLKFGRKFEEMNPYTSLDIFRQFPDLNFDKKTNRKNEKRVSQKISKTCTSIRV